MPLYLKLLQEAFSTEVHALAPVILVLLAIGIATAIFQAAFQIEDATFSLLLKTIAMVLMVLAGGAGMLRGFETLASFWIGHAPDFIRQPWT
jgi:flagellar biosynthetic protein FliQ